MNLDVDIVPIRDSIAGDKLLDPIEAGELCQDQCCAYNIIIWHLDEFWKGNDPLLLQMIIYGEGGTGKLKVIQTMSEAFIARGQSELLIKTAYMGVMTSLIDGKMTHMIGGMSTYRRNSNMSAETKAKMRQFWKHKFYIILDEYLMIAKDFLVLLSRNILIVKEMDGHKNHSGSFGGINMIICGNLHQFPPVAWPMLSALYYPSNVT